MARSAASLPLTRARALRLHWPLLLLGVGVALRLFQYLVDRALYIDEAALALNLLHRTPGELLLPLAYDQAAPPGFLLAVKGAVGLFGSSEAALRLVPLLAGLAALAVFYRLAVRLLPSPGGCIAIALFALSGGLVFFSADLKQYASDVLVVLLLYSLTLWALRRRLDGAAAAGLAAGGAAAIWFAYPALFVLAGIGLVLGLEALARPRYARLAPLAWVAATWLASFALFYAATGLGASRVVEEMRFFWGDVFMPLPPTTAAEVRWFYESFFQLMRNPVGLSLSGVAVLCFLAGCRALWWGERRLLALLLAPLVITLLLSGFGLYPFGGRVLLFLVPGLLLVIAAGAADIQHATARTAPAVGVILIGLLLFHPVLGAAQQVLRGEPYAYMPHRDLKSVLTQVQVQREAGDAVYVQYSADLPFIYYASRLGIEEARVGRSPGRRRIGYTLDDVETLYRAELDSLGADRVWVIIANARTVEGVDEGEHLLRLLDARGTQLETVRATGARAYLYTLD